MTWGLVQADGKGEGVSSVTGGLSHAHCIYGN